MYVGTGTTLRTVRHQIDSIFAESVSKGCSIATHLAFKKKKTAETKISHLLLRRDDAKRPLRRVVHGGQGTVLYWMDRKERIQQ